VDWELRRSGGPPRSAFWISLVLHAVVVVGLILGRALQPEPLEFVTYEIQMVSLPTQEAAEEEPSPATEELVVETPDPQPPEPEAEELPPPPEEEKPEEPEQDPEPEDPQPEEPETTEPEPAEETTEATTSTEAEEEAEEVSTEEVTVRMEGLKRDFPEYYRNILFWVNRCFVPPSGMRSRSLTAVLYFEITRDGTVSDTRIVQRSGNPRFDLAALAAITDCAGRGRFGALPDELPYDVLPVQFTFRPPGDGAPRPGPAHPLPRR
jgi:TonB family protein